jgi:hypothetical protein
VTVQIPLTQGYFAIVDAADADRVLAYKWAAVMKGRNVYALRNVRTAGGKKTTQMLHTFLTGYVRTDHHNGDGLDNRRSNLREATAGENGRNRRRPVVNTSGFKGVTWCKRTRKWSGQIRAGGNRNRFLGYHDTPEAAARAYDNAARELYGEYAAVNFPEPGERAA